jgi:hypothetical protein
MAAQRGSDKILGQLFGDAAPTDRDGLARAVAAAREGGLRVVRWWWKGQPAIDSIRAQLDVGPEEAGGVAQALVGLHAPGAGLAVEVFPYGIPKLDGVRFDVTLNRTVR